MDFHCESYFLFIILITWNVSSIAGGKLFSQGNDRSADDDVDKKDYLQIDPLKGVSKKTDDQIVDENKIDPDKNPDSIELIKSMSVEQNGMELKPKGVTEESKKKIKAEESEGSVPASDKGENDSQSNKRNFVLSLRKRMWPKNIIPYELNATGYDNPKHIELIKKCLAIVADISCVRWLPRSDKLAAEVGHQHYIEIRSGKGCWANLGYSPKKTPQFLSLAKGGCMSGSTVLHEMFHSMGMSHEQGRSDRNKYISVNFSAIMEDQKGEFGKGRTDLTWPYDVESIMQYSLRSFAKEKGLFTMELKDPRLRFLVNSRQSMSFYDVAELLTAYKCSDQCDKSKSPVCKYGVLNHKCKCYCMVGFKGEKCDEVITDTDCGGEINVEYGGDELYITTPNYPKDYPTGKLCRWVIKNMKGWSPRITIEDFHLTSSPLNRCYHWLEVQYNLPGQTGQRKCGEIVDETWTVSSDAKGTMILTFDSKFVQNRPVQRGFRLRVDVVGKGCISNPCVYGKCKDLKDGATKSNFKCECAKGFEGRLCDQVKERSSFRCSFELGAKCIFQNTDKKDDFQWTISTGLSSSQGTGPSHAYKGKYYMLAEMSNPRQPDDKARLSTNVALSEYPRCLKFYYNMFGGSVGSLNVYTDEKGKPIWTKSGNLGAQWLEAAINIPATKGLQIIIEAVRGKDWDSDIALDEITLSIGKCRAKRKECLSSARGEEYKGTLSVTEGGFTCKAWSSVKKYKSKLGKDNNYCRNPNKEARPWCYTTSENKEWDFCSIPQCDYDECTRSDVGYEYEGVVSTTTSGKECQRWDSQKPHKHQYSYLSAHENFCRNPGGKESAPWCYTTDKDKKWEYCDVSKCSNSNKPKECRKTIKGTDYFGSVEKAKDGKSCKQWEKFENDLLGDQGNFCRNVNKYQPWCYTGNKKDAWSYCDVPLCEDRPCHSNPCKNGGTCMEKGSSYTCKCFDTFKGSNCEKYDKPDYTECLMTNTGWEYKGTVNKAKSGKVCKNWKDTKAGKKYKVTDQANYCRNPRNRKSRPFCVTDKFEECDVPKCQFPPKECLENERGDNYFGTMNMDANGYMCQRWDSLTGMNKRKFAYLANEENYCRKTDKRKPWCFTTDPNAKFKMQICPIAQC